MHWWPRKHNQLCHFIQTIPHLLNRSLKNFLVGLSYHQCFTGTAECVATSMEEEEQPEGATSCDHCDSVCSFDSPQFASIMLRQAARGFCRRSLVARGIRTTTTARQDEEALPKAFTERFVKLVPSTMAPPNFPTDFMSKEAKQVNEAPSTVPDKLTFNFYLPHEQIAKAKKVIRCCLCL